MLVCYGVFLLTLQTNAILYNRQTIMNTNRIDIIIPVYNVEPYLRRCLNSILKQTYRHWRAICIDDGSTDGCPAILGEYAASQWWAFPCT